MLLAMTEEADVPCNYEKGVIASQRRGNPGGGDAFRVSSQLKAGDTLIL